MLPESRDEYHHATGEQRHDSKDGDDQKRRKHPWSSARDRPSPGCWPSIESVIILMLMRREPKKRLATDADAAPRPGLNAAFAGLDVPNLAAGPDAAASASAPSGAPWKMGRVVLRRETAQRGGKTVIVVHDFATHLPTS